MKSYFGKAVVFAVLLMISACAFEVKQTTNLSYQDGDSHQPGSDSLDNDMSMTPDTRTDPDAIENQDLTVTDTPLPEEVGDSIEPECIELEGKNDYPECDDGIECTVDWCHIDTCKHTANPSKCPSGDPCKTWNCDEEQGCLADIAVDTPCYIDDDDCVLTATCNADGDCSPVTSVECPDHSCATDGECNPESGICEYAKLLEGPCDDDNPCTGEDKCLDGECQGVFTPDLCKCDSDEDCIPFEDGDMCNGVLVCIDGHCEIDQNSIPNCQEPPDGSCTTVSCNPENGDCESNPLAQGSWCDDDNPCTDKDGCGNDGKCVGETVTQGTSCDTDDDLCTLEKCEEEECVSEGAKVCADPVSSCFEAYCDPESGDCKSNMLDDGSPCSSNPSCSCEQDGACIQGEACNSGLCQGGYNICANCELLEEAGHPCDDDNPSTIGDFCFEKKCRGFETAFWTDSGALALGLQRVTSIGTSFVALGKKEKTNNPGNITPYFVSANGTPEIVNTTPYQSQAMLAIDGKAAVGPPDRAFYYGVSWTGNSKLALALASACPNLGVKIEPSAVVHRTNPQDSDVPSAYYDEFVLVGFEVTAAIAAGQCQIALCGKPQNQNDWICQGFGFNIVVAKLLEGGNKPRVTAAWLPLDKISCSQPAPTCFNANSPALVAVDNGADSGHIMHLVSIHSGSGNQPLWEDLHTENFTASDEGATKTRILDTRVDDAGNILAVGTNGFIYSKPSGAEGFTVPPFASLGGAVPHYAAVYRSNLTTVLLGNVYQSTTGSEGTTEIHVISGVIAGSASLLLDQAAPAQPYFIQLSDFNVCENCVNGTTGPAGLTDLAVLGDHLSSGTEPGTSTVPVLMVSGTVKSPVDGSLVGVLARLSAQ